ncbi:DNA-binding SARP family transcriptional activator [Actinoplanes xinjiangensis]|jgi:DNA-binding SARP family transcriptional activator|uniref:DNA-binding SARP family transcriptional activator n=1 Tax=Actinoplanes xinjiangensis TaxID=512350 RepID=A0A316FBK9_9ACTN|nr:DNA-binding SARP family transcriptional activator [Actinoplanes xinjiangensis]
MSGNSDHPARVLILGPVTIDSSEATETRLSVQLRKVIALLAENREVPLTARYIVDRVWDDDAPDSAVQMVRNHVGMIRRLAGGRGEAVTSIRGGYRLSLETDADRFRVRARQSRLLHEAGRLPESLAAVTEALALWRGAEAMTGVRDVLDLEIAARRLEETRFRAEELAAQCHLRLGRPQEALPILHSMTIRYPSRELPWLQLMAAQASIGRRVEASTETFPQARYHLVEQSGLDMPLLNRFHQELLRGAEAAALLSLTGFPRVP